MGTPGNPNSYNNTGPLGSATNPTTAQGLSRDRENQKFILELDGTQAYESISILDGSISPKRAEIIVDTEGGASADTLETILTNTDGSTTLHDGMKLTLRSADPSRSVTVKHSNSEFGIQMVDAQDVVLGTKWGLKLKLIANKWFEDQGRAEILASEAVDTAEEALGRTDPATTTARGIGRVATSDDLVDGATINNGPAFLSAGDVVSVIEKWRFIVGEFYNFRHPTTKPGFAPLQGGLISGAYQGKNITEYPIWDYLQTTEGQLLCKTEAEWQAMTQAIWHTNADGTTVGWDGIGGAPYYVQDLGAGTLRMPDVRGMYPEAAGFDALGVGEGRGDQGRNATGAFQTLSNINPTGVFISTSAVAAIVSGEASGFGHHSIMFDLSRVQPIGPTFAPRRWGALACAYLGVPAL